MILLAPRLLPDTRPVEPVEGGHAVGFAGTVAREVRLALRGPG